MTLNSTEALSTARSGLRYAALLPLSCQIYLSNCWLQAAHNNGFNFAELLQTLPISLRQRLCRGLQNQVCPLGYFWSLCTANNSTGESALMQVTLAISEVHGQPSQAIEQQSSSDGQEEKVHRADCCQSAVNVRLTLCYVTSACLMQMAAAAELLRGLAGWIGEILAENPREVPEDIQQAAAQLHDEALLVGRLHS